MLEDDWLLGEEASAQGEGSIEESCHSHFLLCYFSLYLGLFLLFSKASLGSGGVEEIFGWELHQRT